MTMAVINTMKEFTIVRRRVVSQIMTTSAQAETEAQALAEINTGRGDYEEQNEWHDCDDITEYPESTPDDVIEVIDVED